MQSYKLASLTSSGSSQTFALKHKLGNLKLSKSLKIITFKDHLLLKASIQKIASLASFESLAQPMTYSRLKFRPILKIQFVFDLKMPTRHVQQGLSLDSGKLGHQTYLRTKWEMWWSWNIGKSNKKICLTKFCQPNNVLLQATPLKIQQMSIFPVVKFYKNPSIIYNQSKSRKLVLIYTNVREISRPTPQNHLYRNLAICHP